MTGTDRVRFCSHCDLSVNNISALTRKQAMKLVREAEGRICVHYVKNPVDDKPIFADRLYRITRRAGIAAGMLSATLSLSTLAHAQGEPTLNKPSTEISRRSDADSAANPGSLAGFVTDAAGAVVPNVFVTILNETTNEVATRLSDERGAYKFENLAAGRYKMTFKGTAGFLELEIPAVDVAGGGETRRDVALSPGEIAVVNITSEPDIYQTVDGGAAFVQYRSGLHTAAADSDAKEVRNLIARGQNVNQKDENYSHITPLFLAVENGSLEIVEILLGFGARVNARDDNRQTPLMRLDEDAAPELVNALLKYGAKVNLFDSEGNTALILAAHSVKAEVLEVLIRHGASVDAPNRAGRTALMEAADADNLANVRVLLAAGANVNLKDKQGETAFDLTTDEEIEKLLMEYGAAVEQEN